MSSNERITKMYWCCNDHDDAFCEFLKPENINATRWCESCQRGQKCELVYIGYQVFEGKTMIEDTTPNNEWFHRKGGGFEKEYLSQVDQISSDQTE